MSIVFFSIIKKKYYQNFFNANFYLQQETKKINLFLVSSFRENWKRTFPALVYLKFYLFIFFLYEKKKNHLKPKYLIFLKIKYLQSIIFYFIFGIFGKFLKIHESHPPSMILKNYFSIVSRPKEYRMLKLFSKRCFLIFLGVDQSILVGVLFLWNRVDNNY